MLFNTLKVVHIFSMIAWMVGLLYLPRLFVNHANPQITKETSETFLNSLDDETLDWVFIDAAHDYESVVKDLLLSKRITTIFNRFFLI